jgi:hypothetical protein
VKKLYTIGVDPGSSTGVAVFSRTAESILSAQTLDFGRTIEFLEANYPPDCCDVIVEDASLNRPTFRKSENRRIQDRMCRNAGFVQRESKLMIAELRRRGYRVLAVRPASEKWNQEKMERITGYKKRTSAHARDAIALAFGVKVVREELAA